MLGWVALSIGNIYTLIPIAIIVILIAAAAGLARGMDIFALFGVDTLAGLGRGIGGGKAGTGLGSAARYRSQSALAGIKSASQRAGKARADKRTNDARARDSAMASNKLDQLFARSNAPPPNATGAAAANKMLTKNGIASQLFVGYPGAARRFMADDRLNKKDFEKAVDAALASRSAKIAKFQDYQRKYSSRDLADLNAQEQRDYLRARMEAAPDEARYKGDVESAMRKRIDRMYDSEMNVGILSKAIPSRLANRYAVISGPKINAANGRGTVVPGTGRVVSPFGRLKYGNSTLHSTAGNKALGDRSNATNVDLASAIPLVGPAVAWASSAHKFARTVYKPPERYSQGLPTDEYVPEKYKLSGKEFYKLYFASKHEKDVPSFAAWAGANEYQNRLFEMEILKKQNEEKGRKRAVGVRAQRSPPPSS